MGNILSKVLIAAVVVTSGQQLQEGDFCSFMDELENDGPSCVHPLECVVARCADPNSFARRMPEFFSKTSSTRQEINGAGSYVKKAEDAEKDGENDRKKADGHEANRKTYLHKAENVLENALHQVQDLENARDRGHGHSHDTTTASRENEEDDDTNSDGP